jgi:hypothetical protein
MGLGPDGFEPRLFQSGCAGSGHLKNAWNVKTPLSATLEI